jgi:hypothetical protein
VQESGSWSVDVASVAFLLDPATGVVLVTYLARRQPATGCGWFVRLVLRRVVGRPGLAGPVTAGADLQRHHGDGGDEDQGAQDPHPAPAVPRARQHDVG